MRRVELLLMRYFRHLSFHEKHGHIQSVFVHPIDIPRPRPTNCSSRVCAGRSIRASDADDVISIPHPQPAPRDKFPDLAMLYQAVRKVRQKYPWRPLSTSTFSAAPVRARPVREPGRAESRLSSRSLLRRGDSEWTGNVELRPSALGPSPPAQGRSSIFFLPSFSRT
ncbi:hypothetical protein BD309DRAFT_964476 [Dichomitus squalens]|nr:hypothetical protein BD309DRAFT_964476 [Dichomitus squalens]